MKTNFIQISSSKTRPIAGVVHLFAFDATTVHDGSFLNDTERARAARYTIDAPRWEFMAGRAQLRRVLAGYLDARPSEIMFSVQASGKPVLVNDPGLHFNVSHSHGRGVIAVATTAVGVDLEIIRVMPNAAGLVKRYFTPEEQTQFELLPDELQDEGFFRGWTGKEALLKAVGVGLAEVEQVAVDLDPRHPPRIIRFDGHDGMYELQTMKRDDGFLISVALSG